MFTPTLNIIPSGNRFILHASTEVPSAAFTAGSASPTAPKSNPVGTNVIAVQLNLLHKKGPAAQQVHIVEHTITDLDLEPGMTISAFVMLNGMILGTADLLINEHGSRVHMAPTRSPSAMRRGAAPTFRVAVHALAAAQARPPLTDMLCQSIAVRNTPKPSAFTGPSQLLNDLGVTDPTQTSNHQQAVQSDLNTIGYHIQLSDVTSGPAVSVSDCADSVAKNAF